MSGSSAESSERPGASSLGSSLLVQLYNNQSDAWQKLVHLFEPVVITWARRAGLQTNDAVDVAQEVFQTVARKIGDFRRERPEDTFRGWLWTVTKNKIRDFWRAKQRLPQAAGGSDAQLQIANLANDVDDTCSHLDARDSHGLLERALGLVRPQFEDRTWQAFWRVMMEGQSVSEVSAELGMSAGAIYVAKSRILSKLRAELGDLFEVDAF